MANPTTGGAAEVLITMSEASMLLIAPRCSVPYSSAHSAVFTEAFIPDVTPRRAMNT